MRSDLESQSISERQTLLRRIRAWMVLFIVGLVLSGLTAFPLETELKALAWGLGVEEGAKGIEQGGLQGWIARVRDGLVETNQNYPFMAYGTDWLAFAHLVIAVAFIGPLIDPVRNKWVITFGMIACAGVVPLALIAGQIRGIPLYWRVIDCSFGLFGVIPLLICRHYICIIERTNSNP
jgi:hypothetical protein